MKKIKVQKIMINNKMNQMKSKIKYKIQMLNNLYKLNKLKNVNQCYKTHKIEVAQKQFIYLQKMEKQLLLIGIN